MSEIHPSHNHFTAVQLPDDIIQSKILPILPAASIARFKCVSKQWRSFLSTQEFQNMHRHHSRRRLLLIDHLSSTSFTFDSESPKPESTTIFPIPFKTRRPSKIFILASLHGLICAFMENTRELVLWNPLTRAYNKLSNSKSQGFYEIGDAVGLYIDSCNDYKILHVKRRRGGVSAYVYSRRLDSWRKIEFLKNAGSRVLNTEWSSVTFSGKSLYFTVSEYWSGGESWIVGFNVDSEKFREIQFPKNLQKDGASYYVINLVEIEKCIHLCIGYDEMGIDMSVGSEVDLWRLTDGEDQWRKVSSVSGIQNVPWTITITKCYYYGKWLVIRGWSRALHVMDINNISDGKICLCRASWFCTLDEPVIYIETLVSPNP